VSFFFLKELAADDDAGRLSQALWDDFVLCAAADRREPRREVQQ
jgi:hypothetical protein